MPRPRRELSAVPAGPRDHVLTIEQLALESGLSVRNIRSHQARGLLPPPEVRRRVGYYGPEHVERLRVIAELQAQGLHLKAVKQLLDDTQGTVERLLSLRRTVAEPVALERSETVTEGELAELLGSSGGERSKLLSKLADLGFVLPIGSGHYEITSPSLLSAVAEALARGITPAHAVELVDSLHRHADTIARRLMRNFVDDIWKPYLESGRPDDRWPELAESIARLRPLGVQALDAMFTHTIGRHIDRTLGDATKRLSERKN